MRIVVSKFNDIILFLLIFHRMIFLKSSAQAIERLREL